MTDLEKHMERIIQPQPSYVGGSLYMKKLDMKVICVSDIIKYYGVSEVTKDLQIGKTYTCTDIWEAGLQGANRDIQLFFVNNEYYPSDMFKLLDEVREDKLNEILK